MAWRTYTEADLPAIEALQAKLETRVKMSTPLPKLDERPILLALVRVRDTDGVITNVAALEAEAEIMLLGEEALAFEEWDQAATILTQVCCAYRLRMVRAFVPTVSLQAKTNRGSAIQRILHYFGFVREDPARITTYTRPLV
jgi:hypothetical protein